MGWPAGRTAAILLTVLMPGLGHIHLGWIGRGLAIWGVTFVAYAAALFAWATWVFVPLVPAVVAAMAWVTGQGLLWRDIERLPPDGPGRRAPAPAWVQAVVFASLGVLPVMAFLQVAFARFVGTVEVDGQSMFPALLAGDRVVFDRQGFATEPPEPGQLVVVRLGERDTVARVIAGAGQTVHLRSGEPVIDGQTTPRARLRGVSVARFDRALSTRLDALDCFLEATDEREYVVSYARSPVRVRDPGPVRVRSGEVFVAGDNRTATVAERVYGKVDLAQVVGRPRFVWASYDAEGRRREGRGGLAFR